VIAIVDYGLGNVLAFRNAYERLNVPVRIARAAGDLVGATRLILPGVGSFDYAMGRFESSGLREPVQEMVLQQGTPVLGVCVGMQMLANSSEEGHRIGLGWIRGRVCKFHSANLALPHMGWNEVQARHANGLYRGMQADPRFYFLHSYHFMCDEPEEAVATADYGGNFCCSVHRENIYGVQFHPEKSHHWGGQLLFNFASL